MFDLLKINVVFISRSWYYIRNNISYTYKKNTCY